jgi:hypothetical protein
MLRLWIIYICTYILKLFDHLFWFYFYGRFIFLMILLCVRQRLEMTELVLLSLNIKSFTFQEHHKLVRDYHSKYNSKTIPHLRIILF